MRMPFGKHRGEHLEDIEEISYLKWLEEQEWLEDALREAVQFEISRREGQETSRGRVLKKGRTVDWH